jgi:mono/diheme cytochrome c family protein
MVGFSVPRAARPGAAAFLLTLALTGCGDQTYPHDLAYPLRADLIIDPIQPKEIAAQTFYADPPGRLDESIRELVQKETTILHYDPKKLTPDERKQLAEALKEAFGSPAQPIVAASADHPDGAAIDAAVTALRLDPERLANGSRLFRRHCLQCHGLPGDGRGPTAAWVHPHPRDYRSGLFKFISSDPEKNPRRKPLRADLMRVLTKGVEGTSMPSFGLLPADDLEDLISYVMHLSIRGQVELDTIALLLKARDEVEKLKKEGKEPSEPPVYLRELESGEAGPKATIDSNVQAALRQAVVDQWLGSASQQIKPGLAAEDVAKKTDTVKNRWDAIERGHKNFLAAGCLQCHTDYGRQANFKYDLWGTPVRPANLTVGTYRGGRRPIDLFWRLRGGVGPSGMPVYSPKKKDDKGNETAEVDEDKVWDLIAFLQALPYPESLPPWVRDKVYGPPAKAEPKKD